ncbi:hypothetical protein A3K86_11745 [Photobacterium jeanii]|uniref:Uncharacterized protein n=1 Tax=Photobacterium jeanii TaxID=858640 RepID=A0A178KC10_9GAMM|nr:hypothetical protein [Photobacterium jeanii]OAN14244.1 hypothetical protein A3K86_11745 [Photobacterium jeanii]PST89765.1 hypothetical protein C9I91_12360 [Photobacterium jeanii]
MKQRGAITLLVTTMVAVASLLFSLASYKNVFYQIKRTQNEVLTSQAHWKAEGGLECGYTTMKNSSNPENADLPVFFPAGCDSELGIDLKATKEPTTSNIILSSSFSDRAKKIIERTVIVKSNNNSSGVLQTGSNMYTHSSIEIKKPDPGKEQSVGWECIAVKYRGVFSPTGSIINKGLSHINNDSFDRKGKDCLSTHMTNSGGGQNLLKDIVKDENMSPFKDFFGVSDAEHNKARDDKFDIILTDTSTGGKGENPYNGFAGCGPKIVEAMQKGHDAVWVEGHCDINAADFQKIVTLSQKLDGAMLLVHDGLFSIYPNSNANADNKFQGIIFHYNVDYKVNFADWNKSQAYSQLSHIPSVFGDNVKEASYFQRGSLWVSGGLILDAKHQESGKNKAQNALLDTSSVITYNGKHFKKFGGGGTEIKWLEGSWNDF